MLLIYICCAFVSLDNKLYKMHGTYIKRGYSNFFYYCAQLCNVDTSTCNIK
jgi:hypothetical protein